jgi:hypothetical protein
MVVDAVNFIARAKAEGADFVCFPETYPGPWRMPAQFDPTPRLAEAAAKHGINTTCGTIEPLSHNEGTTRSRAPQNNSSRLRLARGHATFALHAPSPRSRSETPPRIYRQPP